MLGNKGFGLNSGTAGKYFPALTGVRVMSAFLVYCSHFNGLEKGSLFHGVMDELHFMVTVFFVLSGFVIGYRYINTFEPSKSWLKDYYLNRLARLYPIYFLLTNVIFVVHYLKEGYTHGLAVSYFLSITFLKGFSDLFKFHGIAPGWSLCVEVCFYAAVPLFFLLYKRGKPYLILFPLGFITAGLLLVAFFSKFDLYGIFSGYRFMFIYTFFGRCTEFFLGALLALFLRSGRFTNLNLRFPFFTTAGFVFLLATPWIFYYLKGDAERGIFQPVSIAFNNGVLPVFICMFFLGLVTERSLLRRFFEIPPLVTLGKASYVFYLIHFGTLQVLLDSVIPPNFFVRYVVLTLLAFFIHTFLEGPLNRQIRKLTHRNRPISA